MANAIRFLNVFAFLESGLLKNPLYMKTNLFSLCKLIVKKIIRVFNVNLLIFVFDWWGLGSQLNYEKFLAFFIIVLKSKQGIFYDFSCELSYKWVNAGHYDLWKLLIGPSKNYWTKVIRGIYSQKREENPIFSAHKCLLMITTARFD